MSALWRVVHPVILYLASPHTITRFGGGYEELMRLFMAGGVSGNLKPFWSEVAGRIRKGEPIDRAKDESIKAFLNDQSATFMDYRPYVLESFFYCDETTEKLIPHFGDFLLDSGAFTFMQGKGGTPDFDDYAERYADFINRNKVRKYFELDIDSVVGYPRVKQIRAKLERLTGIQPIPVWHRSRGKEEYEAMCREYPYVAIGGLVDGAKKGEYARQFWKYFPWFINTAHDNGAMIHALGFTSLDGIRAYHFDSVESTAWTTGNRFGYLYWFDGRTMQKKDAPKGHRIRDSRTAALHNFTEWVKFQKYADKYL